MRTFLFALVLLGTAGFILDLLILEHTASFLQWLPLAVLVAGFASEIGLLLRPSRGTVRTFQIMMLLFVSLGLLGLFLHYRGNYLFELEVEPGTGGLELLGAAALGGVPVLAPGGMAQLGLLGLIYGYRHPSLAESPTGSSTESPTGPV